MKTLHAWLESGDRRLPQFLGPRLRYFKKEVLEFSNLHSSAVNRAEEALEEHHKRIYTNDFPTMRHGFFDTQRALSMATKKYGSKHTILEAVAAKFLQWYHGLLWPEAECDPQTCIGHPSSSGPFPRSVDPHAFASYCSEISNLYSKYRLWMNWHKTFNVGGINAIIELCEKLEKFCTANNTGNWVQRLFSRSVALYGEVSSVAENVFVLHPPTADPHGQHTPLFTDFAESSLLPSLPGLMESGIYRDVRTSGVHALFSMPSIHKATVSTVGPRLLTWSDVESAFTTLSEWISICRKVQVDWDWDIGGIVARVLVGDAKVTGDTLNLGDSDLSTRIRRLGEEDDAHLQQWYQRISDMIDTRDRSKFLAEDDMKPLDEALILATEGRTFFFTIFKRSVQSGIGLGPASTAVGDSVRVMPGGRTHILLRSLKKSHGSRVPTYGVVGDCFFIDTTDEDDDFQGSSREETGLELLQDDDGAWPGWLPEELLRGTVTQRVYLF